MCHGRETREVYTEFWLGDLRDRSHLEDLTVDVRIILKLIFKKWDGETYTGLIGLRIGTRWRALVNAVTNLRLHKMRGTS